MTSNLGTIANPIRCEDPVGERSYLCQLVSEAHGFIQYTRMGSFRTERNLVDGYAITDLRGKKIAELYFDMYHPGYVEKALPKGFRRIDPSVLEEQLFAKMFGSSPDRSVMRDQIVISQESHGYVESKAQRLLLCGPLYYHSRDYFGYPRKDWGWLEIVDASMQLIEDYAGRLETHPIKVENALIANQMLQTFHFDAENSERIDSTVEPVLVCATHRVTAEALQFWFQRSTFEGENLP